MIVSDGPNKSIAPNLRELCIEERCIEERRQYQAFDWTQMACCDGLREEPVVVKSYTESDTQVLILI